MIELPPKIDRKTLINVLFKKSNPEIRRRYENLKRRVAEVMEYPGVVARGLNAEGE